VSRVVQSPLGTTLPYGELVGSEELARAYDAAVDASPDIDQFCSQHAFVTAAFEGLQPGRQARIQRAGDGWLAFAERHAALFGDPRPRLLLEPLEAMWGLCCPVVGVDEPALATALGDLVTEGEEAPVVLVCGLRAGSPRLLAIAAALAPRHRLVGGAETVRVVASLEGGVDGFLERRSSNFRKALRRAHRAAIARGIVYERHAPRTVEEATALYERAARLDDLSWKGRAETGLHASGLYSFYAQMLPRLARQGALRIGFLVDGGQDVAYLFGGLRGGTFRGHQFAFRAGREAESLGNVVQLCELERLSDEGARRYDLGTEAEYKLRWGEEADRTTSIIAIPRRGRM
jgi:hypothetical protein